MERRPDGRTEKRNNKCIYLCLSVEEAPYEANHVESRCKKRIPDVRSQTDGQALAFLLHASIENSPAARCGGGGKAPRQHATAAHCGS